MTSAPAALNFATPWMWAGFIAFVLVMLVLDLFAFGGRRVHKVSIKEALTWSFVWIVLSLTFNVLLWWYLKHQYGEVYARTKAFEFLAGYVIEKSLSIDNIFVFLLIFQSFHVSLEYQRRILVYGVLGAIVLRAIMILLGSWVVQEFHWVLYGFGAFLVFTGLRMLMTTEQEPDLQSNPMIRFARRYLKMADEYHGERFVISRGRKRYFTLLFLVLILIEGSDIVFAVDSIPAIFAITTDPFIVFTSNIFAILGLRALYFLLAEMADRFALLKYGLAMVLAFVGAKMLIEPWVHVSIQLSLSVIGVLIGASIAVSFLSTRKHS